MNPLRVDEVHLKTSKALGEPHLPTYCDICSSLGNIWLHNSVACFMIKAPWPLIFE